jgi:hypothetical protein
MLAKLVAASNGLALAASAVGEKRERQEDEDQQPPAQRARLTTAERRAEYNARLAVRREARQRR